MQLCFLHLLLVCPADCLRLNIQSFVESMVNVGVASVFVGEPPSAFPQRRLKVDFSRIEMSPRLNNLLEGLLQPAYEDRLTATQAKAVLAGQGPAKQQQRQQQKAWNPFGQDGWEEARQGPRRSSSDRQVSYCNCSHVENALL